jgi:hypothetical protein
MRKWIVERTWVVEAESANKALDAARPGEHTHIRVYEGEEARPWEDDVDWSEVARDDRAERGECWYKIHSDVCEVHGVTHD